VDCGAKGLSEEAEKPKCSWVGARWLEEKSSVVGGWLVDWNAALKEGVGVGVAVGASAGVCAGKEEEKSSLGASLCSFGIGDSGWKDEGDEVRVDEKENCWSG
jgi:hypothetical protein